MPKVSVIIPTYNCAEYIKDAVDSVLGQTYRDYEIIVVDDGSNDDTRAVLDSYIKQSLINYVYQRNMRQACARNTGIKIAKGEFIAFLDADDMWAPERLELQVPALISNPKIGLVHSDLNAIREDGILLHALRSSFDTDLIERHSGDIFEPFFRRDIYISCPTVMVRRECFDEVGLFDENPTGSGFEDSEMWLRILRHYEAYYIHKPLATYRMRPGSASKNRKNMIKAHRYVIEKLAHQFELPTALVKRANKGLCKEWGLGQYAIPKYIREAKRFIMSYGMAR